MLLALAVLTLLVQAVVLVRLVTGARTICRLTDEPPLAPAEHHPTVSIVLAARDEGRAIEQAVRSLLAQQYPGLELVAVDDRSSDATGAILDSLAAADPRLRVVHVRELPPGWLGKNHALYLGAEATTGEWLLFTDGDIVMEPDAVARALAFAQRRRLDFLAVPPGAIIPTAPLNLFLTFFVVALFAWIRPWKARDPHSRVHVGTGAFNLLRRSTYQALGTHRRIALRPDDDLKLGKAAKLAGARQDLVSGEGMLTVEWYSTLGEAWVGLRKNALAGLDYHASLFVGAAAFTLLVHVWPVVALFLTSGLTRAAYLASYLVSVLAYARVAGRRRPWLAPAVPIAAILMLAALGAAIARTLRRGGIEWRGTFYPLDELKRNVV